MTSVEDVTDRNGDSHVASHDGGQSSGLLTLPTTATDVNSSTSSNNSNLNNAPPVKKVSRFQVSIVREGRITDFCNAFKFFKISFCF